MAESPKKRRVTDRDWRRVAEFIHAEYQGRKGRRADIEKQWDQVDRQIAMRPIPLKDKFGNDKDMEWFPNLELPNQAETLETLCADARRFLFADDRNYFSAHAGMTDDYLEKVDFKSMILGDSLEVPSKMTQETADALVEGVLTHTHAGYDFRGMWDMFNAEAFKYGLAAARGVMGEGEVFFSDSRGTRKQRYRKPYFVPRPIRNTYPDDSTNAVLHQGYVARPSTIEVKWQNVDDLMMAAGKGSTDPTKETGGWMPVRLKDIEGDAKRNVMVLEYEGDLVMPRSSGPSLYLPDCMVSVVVSAGGPVVFRYREKEFSFHSYIFQHYHREHVDSIYAASPLMKAAPIQNAASMALNNTLAGMLLNALPPVTWNPQDPQMQREGGPRIYPGAVWATATGVDPQRISDPQALLVGYVKLLEQYSDVTGMSAPRLGAQTKSHQSAFAVDVEQSRGVVRTVDYVQSVKRGSMMSWLYMEYEMLRASMEKQPVYLNKFEGWVEIGKESLPEIVTFDVEGAGGPIEERERRAEQQNALAQALSIEFTKRQIAASGADVGPLMDLTQAQKSILTQGKFSDVDKFFAAASPAQAGGTPVLPGVGGPADALLGTPGDQLAQVAELAGTV